MDFWQRCERRLQKIGVILLCAFGFFSDFKPSEAFLTPYLVGIGYKKHEVNDIIYPWWGYSYLISLLVVAVLTEVIKHRFMIKIGALARLSTRILLLWGTSILAMQFMQIVFGFASATEIVFFSYVYLLVPEGRYQAATSYLASSQLLAHVLSAFFGQILFDFGKVSLRALFVVSLVSVSISVIIVFLFPPPGPQKEAHSEYVPIEYPTVNKTFDSDYITADQGVSSGKSKCCSIWRAAVKERVRYLFRAYGNWEVCMWSGVMWLGIGLNGLVLNYQYSFFFDIDPKSLFNGYVMGGARICGFIGSILPLIFVPKDEMKFRAAVIVQISLALCSVFILVMALSQAIFLAYIAYSLYELVFVLSYTVVKAHLARLMKGRVVIMLIVNTLIGVALQDILQAILYGLSVRVQFFVWGIAFVVLCVGFSILFAVVRRVWRRENLVV